MLREGRELGEGRGGGANYRGFKMREGSRLKVAHARHGVHVFMYVRKLGSFSLPFFLVHSNKGP